MPVSTATVRIKRLVWRACVSIRKKARSRNASLELPSLRANQTQVWSSSVFRNPTTARRMPPASSHKTLSAKQIDTLKRWVAKAPVEGALVVRGAGSSEPARRGQQSWVKNPIDQFILAKLEAQALTPRARRIAAR